MRTRGAVLNESPGHYEIVELELDEPRQDELLVRMVAAGLCHTDDHFAVGDALAGTYPMAGGHEGAGIVEAVGPNTGRFEPGDHVVFSFLPACGRCRWCATGNQNLCDLGRYVLKGSRFDGSESYRMHTPDGRPVGQLCGISTFTERTVVSVDSAIKMDPSLPLDKVCLLGCGVGTGWGSSVNMAPVKAGDTVIVMGVGGIGINAVQGAVHAGASHVIAVDPIELKRDVAKQVGATILCEDMQEATDRARALTNGQGADAAIVTVGQLEGEHVAEAFSSIRKGGTVVVTAVGHRENIGVPISLTELTLYQKRLQGSHYGGCNPTWDIPRQAQLYRDGSLKLDDLITKTYALEQIQQGFMDQREGKTVRGVILFDE
jgi:NDMA-dependent alcohol dehydrogenase